MACGLEPGMAGEPALPAGQTVDPPSIRDRSELGVGKRGHAGVLPIRAVFRVGPLSAALWQYRRARSPAGAAVRELAHMSFGMLSADLVGRGPAPTFFRAPQGCWDAGDMMGLTCGQVGEPACRTITRLKNTAAAPSRAPYTHTRRPDTTAQPWSPPQRKKPGRAAPR